jgi:transcriptional regulator with GAF, ATPase, and Fis domain
VGGPMSREEPARTIQVTKTSMDSERPKDKRHHPRFSLLLYHREGAQIVPLTTGVSVTVGRTAPSDVTINDFNLSRQHARFTLTDGGQLTVEDMGSTNGTLVDGHAVERADLDPGQEVTLGSVTATFHALTGDQRPPSSTDFAGHERFRAALETEVVRAKFFGRRVAVLLVQAVEPQAVHVRFWAPRAQTMLRPVDRLGLYSNESIQILLPEATAKQASETATSLIRLLADSPTHPATVVCGIAVFPDTATHPEELLGQSRAAAQAANQNAPVHVADGQEPRTFTRTEGSHVESMIVAESGPMRHLLSTAARVARGNLPVLLHGETGTGKEVLSRYIHEESPRSRKPLVCVNCAAIPQQLVESTLFGHERGAFTGANTQQKGVFEAADGGTVFLDEIGELPAPAQAALLRVLETKRFARVGSTREISVDVRVIAATHRDLEQMVEESLFRQDLLYRLNAVLLPIPPLRDRTEDIPVLAQRFLDEANKANNGNVRGIDPGAVELLRSYTWPGNVRELKNSIERAVVIAQGDTLVVDDLPERIRALSLRPPPLPRISLDEIDTSSAISPLELALTGIGGDFRTRMERLEAELLTHALREAGWNQTEAARQLQMPLRTLVYKIRMHGIRRPESARKR